MSDISSVPRYYYVHSIQLMSESGFWLRFMQMFPFDFCQLLGHVPPSMARKASSVVELGETETIDIGWEHFRSVFWALHASFAASIIPLLIEIVWFNVDRMVKRSKARKERPVQRRKRCAYGLNHYSA